MSEIPGTPTLSPSSESQVTNLLTDSQQESLCLEEVLGMLQHLDLVLSRSPGLKPLLSQLFLRLTWLQMRHPVDALTREKAHAMNLIARRALQPISLS